MSTGGVIGLGVATLVALVLIVWTARVLLERKRLRRLFGPEYDIAMQAGESRSAAARELAARERQHSEFDLRDFSPATFEHYSRCWAELQEEFVNSPAKAVADADRLVTELMAERGYPTEGYEAQLSVLSVEHALTLEHYRAAHDITELLELGDASTEDLRLAIVHYRTLFQDLLRSGARKETTDA